MECIIEKKCSFLKSVFTYKDLPKEDLKEIAFWGRSNVGKSTLLNAIIKSNLARTSKTPGRTQSLNFFEIPFQMRFVDLPGYGYSKASKVKIKQWNNLIIEYLAKRKNLNSIFLLIDSRHGIKSIDLDAINILESFGNHFFVVLTKIDKVNKSQLDICSNSIKELINNVVSGDNEIFMTSFTKKQGIKNLKNKIVRILQQ